MESILVGGGGGEVTWLHTSPGHDEIIRVGKKHSKYRHLPYSTDH